jgi:hypothetical protein
MNKPHKWQEVIKAWADGAVIEFRDYHESNWAVIHRPKWLSLTGEYRVQPGKDTFQIPLIPQEHSSKREWVSLTNDEITDCIMFEAQGYWRAFGKAIEAKLKERNT